MRRFAISFIISILSDQAKMRSGDNDFRFCHITQPSCKKMIAQMFDDRKDQHTHPCDIRWDPVVSSHLRFHHNSSMKQTQNLLEGWQHNAEINIQLDKKSNLQNWCCGITGMWTVAIVLILCPDDSQCVVCVFFLNIYFGFICVRLQYFFLNVFTIKLVNSVNAQSAINISVMTATPC